VADFFIYDTTTGALWYDADGAGPIELYRFATLAGTPFFTVPTGGLLLRQPHWQQRHHLLLVRKRQVQRTAIDGKL
jgi:hypothetical protein